MNETSREYPKRVNRVLDYIESNLHGDLSLENLAEKAHYSPYHFHRVFSTVVNERLNEYINRKRIERIASILLVNKEITRIDLVYQYGFNSDSSFSRAFKKYYGISPTQFKSEGKNLLSKIGIEPFPTVKYIYTNEDVIQWIEMNAQITVQELSEIQLAGISQIGSSDKVGAIFQRLMAWGHQNNVLATANFKAITIYHDNPNVTQDSKVRLSACITVKQKIEADKEVRPLTIRKAIYAIGRFEIEAANISKAWKGMNNWVIESGYEFRDGDYFEIYHNDHQTHPEQKFIIDICIPLEKTDNLRLEETNHMDLSRFTKKSSLREKQLNYHELIGYMKELRAFFHKQYNGLFKLGNLYLGNPEFSYFSLTTEDLKKLKLKFVIILNHKTGCFRICLSGQNKNIRKKYWQMFKASDWSQYHLAERIDNSLSIVDHTLVEEPDFSNRSALTEQIEAESLKFIKELKSVFT